MAVAQSPSLLRDREADEHGRVTNIELFFDLVFVFAVTQLSHSLLQHLSLMGLVHTGILFAAVWWVWIDTSWVTNWLNPDRTPVRILLLVLMAAGLVLSTSLPEAFGARGATFALALVGMQIGRSLFMLWALGNGSPSNTRNFERITVWMTVASLFWLAGAAVEGEARLAIWLIALLFDCIAPAVGFRVPGLGRSKTSDWDVEGSHIAERCSLFIIIALGESILVTGATFANLHWDAANVTAFIIAFVGSVAMWWIYFDTGAGRASHNISTAEDPGHLARLAYTYIHLLIVAGIIVSAVADETVLAHPTGHMKVWTIAVILGGPFLYVFGTAYFKRTITGNLPLSHVVGFGLLVVAGPSSHWLTPISLSAAATVALVIVAAWETISLRGRLFAS